MYGRVYSEEFKAEALELLESSGKSMHQLERELGIGRGCLARWKIEQGDSSNDAIGDERRDPQAVIRDLRRELEVVRMERDILKKAVAIFSRPKP
ncbi:MAG: transposase [Anaerolineae bacterium]